MEKGKLEFDLPENENEFLAAIHGMRYKLAIEQTLYWIMRVCKGKVPLYDDGHPDSLTEADQKVLEKVADKLREECEGAPLD